MDEQVQKSLKSVNTSSKSSFRLLSALLALLLLAGCGGGASDGDVSKSQSNADATEVEEIPVAARPVISLTTDFDYHYDNDLGAIVNRMETQLPGVDAENRESYIPNSPPRSTPSGIMRSIRRRKAFRNAKVSWRKSWRRKVPSMSFIMKHRLIICKAHGSFMVVPLAAWKFF